MTLHAMRFGWAAILISAAACVWYLMPAGTPFEGADAARPASPRSFEDSDDITDAALGRRLQLSHERLESKSMTIEEFRSGRLTLLQAATRFRDLDSVYTSLQSRMNPADAALCEGEHYCRLVIRWEHALLIIRSPEAADEVANQRETELQRLRESDGIIRLPQSPEGR